MNLTFGGARPDGAPTDQIGNVLRRDHVEELGTRGQAEFVDLPQQLARQPNPFVDLETVVEVGVVDEALPAHRRPRFLEIHAHDNEQVVLQPLGLFLEQPRVFHGGVEIVDRAWPDDHQQPIVGAVENTV